MIKAATTDITKGWIYDAHRGFNQEEVQRFCVRNDFWQKHRLSMKGIPTHEKLKKLKEWRDQMLDGNFTHESTMSQLERMVTVQIDNYLGALRRGGQLDDNNMIRKYI